MLPLFLAAVLLTAIPANATVNLYNTNSTFNGSSISATCQSALIASINCDPSIQILSNVYFAASSLLSSICTTTCSAALSSYRTSVLSACSSDNFLLISGTQYPVTYPADYVTFYYNQTCLTSGSSYCLDDTGAYYNLSSANSAVDTYADLPNSLVCDPCFLQTGQLQLQSPIAHNPDLANNWTAILSRCDTNAYTYVSPSATLAPPAYVFLFYFVYFSAYVIFRSVRIKRLLSMAHEVTLPLVSLDPTLYSPVILALQFRPPRVLFPIKYTKSTFSRSLLIYSQFIALNGLDQGCATISEQVGKTLCLPQACELYTIKANDTCASIGQAYNLTFAQVVSLNFQLDPACQTIPDKVGSTLCVG